MRRNKKAERERGREVVVTVVLKGSAIIERNVLCLAKHEIMNVTLFFSVQVIAYIVNWLSPITRQENVTCRK